MAKIDEPVTPQDEDDDEEMEFVPDVDGALFGVHINILMDGKSFIDEVSRVESKNSFYSRLSGSRPSGTMRIASSDDLMAVGSWKFARPRLKTDWDRLDAHKLGHGRVTTEEAFWVVIITMGIASARDCILTNHDIEWYVLHFFAFWGVLFSSIVYSARFNDCDFWHTFVWGCIALGLLFQMAYLNKSLTGFAYATCALHLIIAMAHTRVAILLPRARTYCSWFAAQSAAHAILFATISQLSNPDGYLERRLLWINVFMEPSGSLLWEVCVAVLDVADPASEQAQGYGRPSDVPGDFAYLLARHEGIHMMIIVCSFLFPLGLHGASFVASPESASIIMLGNLFAIFLKLSIHDLDIVASKGQDSWRHPLRRGWVHSRLFLSIFPLSILGIALTGVGFVVAAEDAHGLAHKTPGGTATKSNATFARYLLLLGPLTTLLVFTCNKLLTKPTRAVVYWVKIGCLMICALAFSMPCILELGRLVTVICSVCVQLFVFLSQLACEWWAHHTTDSEDATASDSEEFSFTWNASRLLKDWPNIHEKIGALVSSHEHFFTVLLAVAVFSLNENLAKTHDLWEYGLHFFTIYAGLAMTMRYAARFNDNDGAHALVWNIYEFIFLLQLEGLSSGSLQLFAASTCAIFLWSAVGFWGRVAASLERVRPFAQYFIVCSLLFSLVFLVQYFIQHGPFVSWLLFGFVVFAILCEPALVCWMRCYMTNEEERMRFDVPMNIEYVVRRFNGLYIEVLGVGIIVPNAFFPNSFEHPLLVLIGVFLAGAMALLVKSAIFDSEPVSASRHAIHQSQKKAVMFFWLHPFTLLAVCILGGAFHMLIPSIGAAGSAVHSSFKQNVLCAASCLLWVSLATTKMLHAPRHVHLHWTKVVVTAFGCPASLVVVAFKNIGDMAALIYITSLASMIVGFDFLVNCTSEDDGPNAQRTKSSPLV